MVVNRNVVELLLAGWLARHWAGQAVKFITKAWKLYKG